MTNHFVPLEEISARLGMPAKRLRAALSGGNVEVGADGNHALEQVLACLNDLPLAQQRHLRAHQRCELAAAKSNWNAPYDLLVPYRPVAFAPAAGAEAKSAEAQPLTAPTRSHATQQELAAWWAVPEAEVRTLAKLLSLPHSQAGQGVAEFYGVVDLAAKQVANAGFEAALAAAKSPSGSSTAPWDVAADRHLDQVGQELSAAPWFDADWADEEDEAEFYFTRKPRSAKRAAEAQAVRAAQRRERIRVQRLEREIAARVQVRVRDRESDDVARYAAYYVGPTNSGKTYTALTALSAAYEAAAALDDVPTGSFVYAGPLRMLAHEVYVKLAAKYGAEQVGFLTGEEQINPDAPILACTVEMAPASGQLLVLDEAHWLADQARGANWTNLLLGSTYGSYHVLCAQEALGAVQLLLNDVAQQETFTFTRKTPLTYAGYVKLRDVPPRSAVVAFSRKAVYALANMLEARGHKVGVLYGALPLAVRKAQIERYLSGEYEVMVVTDVIGHGINLPIDHVVFAQTEKFDGVERRELRIWEAAQIAGRAGRFGLSAQGSVHLLSGRDWFSRNEKLVRTAALAGEGKVRTDLNVREAVITPSLSDLHVSAVPELPVALSAWQTKARELLRGRGISPAALAEVHELLAALATPRDLPLQPGGKDTWPVPLAEVWQLASGPFNPKGPTVQRIFRWLSEPARAESTVLSEHFAQLLAPLSEAVEAVGVHNADQVGRLEASVSGIGELKMAHLMFGQLGTLLFAELLEAEDRLNSAINSTLASLITAGTYGKCAACGRATPPWFNFCDTCHYEQQTSRR